MSESDEIRVRREAHNYLIRNNHNLQLDLAENVKEALIDIYVAGYKANSGEVDPDELEEMIDDAVKDRMEDDELISIKDLKVNNL